ncbi:hypothetical protein MTP99_004054 [Tenebrio molitor]|nr:hypothetical protein MTP99_004054 [Tenebrio molitor]
MNMGIIGKREIRYENFVKMARTSCNRGQGQIIQFGLMMDQFVPKLKACLDPAHRRLFWTQHYLGQEEVASTTPKQHSPGRRTSSRD